MARLLEMIMAAFAASAVAPDWLAGCWMADSEGRRSVELWSPVGAGRLLGMGFRSGGGEWAFEYLRIERSPEGKIHYVAQPGGGTATEFRLLESGPDRAIFGNDEHDYPQRVGYRRDAGRLTAWISLADGSDRVEWSWTRADCNAVFDPVD